MIPDILASRYCSKDLYSIWSPEGKILLERKFWIAVMKAQRNLGIDIPQSAIDEYENVMETIDLASIAARERKLRHDVKSRIEEFCDLAGHEHIHKGMTSRDLTDNVEQLQIINSLRLLRIKAVALLKQLSLKSLSSKDMIFVARTHNVPAQPTTLGKRLAMFGEEILFALKRLDHLIDNYPLRGLKGAVGTNLDQSVLFNGDEKKVNQLGEKIMDHLDCKSVFNALGQVYPRGLDLETVNALTTLSSGISSLAKTIRLMAGQELASEGFQNGQVGSSAMPHKINTRTSERINGFHHILSGFSSMLSGSAGDQWNEGDVSCSVIRRVALPGAFFAADGQLEAAITVVSEMVFYESAIAFELKQNLPFLCSTSLLMEAVRNGGKRESNHEIIKKHSLEILEGLRKGEIHENDLAQRLSEDECFQLDHEQISLVLENSKNFVASAPEQVEKFAEEVSKWEERFPKSKNLAPETLF